MTTQTPMGDAAHTPMGEGGGTPIGPRRGPKACTTSGWGDAARGTTAGSPAEPAHERRWAPVSTRWARALRVACAAGALPRPTVARLTPLPLGVNDPLRPSITAWLPTLDNEVDDVELVLAVAAAVDDELSGLLSAERRVVLDTCLPGWRDPTVRRWLGVVA